MELKNIEQERPGPGLLRKIQRQFKKKNGIKIQLIIAKLYYRNIKNEYDIEKLPSTDQI
jgi:hypothetical protein